MQYYFREIIHVLRRKINYLRMYGIFYQKSIFTETAAKSVHKCKKHDFFH